MWSPLNRRALLHRLGGVIALTISGPGLSGCGFKPLYGGRTGSMVVSALAQVEVARIDERIGQMLRNALQRRMERSGGARKRFLLTCSVAESTEELGLSKDGYAHRTNLTLTVTFTLTDKGKTLLSGTTQGIVAYNILPQPYASIVSERDSRRRAVVQVADDITRRLASYFLQTQPPSAGGAGASG